MKLTAFTDYSLRVLMYLAADPTQRATIAQIAAAFDISEHHLVKVVHFLGRQGWLTTLRGKGGGLQLAQPPEGINVGRVVRDTEGLALPAECFLPEGNQCVLTPVCRLKNVLAEAVRAFYQVLDQYTLADISKNRQALAKVLLLRAA